MNAVTASATESASPPPTKVLVAVHGIGEQVGYATVQSVAGRLGAFLGCPAGIPLGRFYRTADKIIAPGPVLMSGHDPSALAGMGLAEVYWAAIARKASQDGFILEESKKWGHTITARLSAGAEASGEGLPARERQRIQSVLDEIIETVLVLDRLTFLARKAGILDFNLRALLDSFVGDVQIVADFEGYRDQILAEVDQVMTASQQLSPKPDEVELYLVAHSEGTVIAFRALLGALADPDKHRWIRRVKGFMTIGSPVEVHHILWPHLWRQEPRLIPSADLDQAFHIPWVNYMDYADPIAYPLTETTKWLRERGFARHISPTEVKFSRSYLPGKAHTDYWADGEVFGHFLETVVKPAGAREDRDARFQRLPRTKRAAVVTGYVVPQLLIVLLMLGATYLFYRPVLSVIGATHLTAISITRDVLGIGLLLLGITAASRLPRLTNQYRWWFVSAALLALSMVAYATITCPAAQQSLGTAFQDVRWLPEAPFRTLAAWSGPVWQSWGWDCKTVVPPGSNVSAATAGTLGVAALLTLICAIVASWRPAWIPRLLPSLGLIASGVLVILFLRSLEEGVKGDLWPLLLGGAAFFYLWWLATLLFDLNFVWQRFVRNAAVTDAMSRIVMKGYQPFVADRVMKAVSRRLGTDD